MMHVTACYRMQIDSNFNFFEQYITMRSDFVRLKMMFLVTNFRIISIDRRTSLWISSHYELGWTT